MTEHTQAQASERYSFVCNGGCGVCSVKVRPFECERTETIEGEHLGSKYQPQIVSSCCGAEVHVYDNQADEWGAEVVLASRSTEPGGEATPPASKAVRAFLFSEYNKCGTTPKQIARQRRIGALLDSFDRKTK